MSQDSDRLLAKTTGLVLAFSVLPQLLYMHFVLGMPFRESSSAHFYLGIITTSAVGAALYLLSYFLVYRQAKMGVEKHIILTAVLIGIFSTIIMTFAPLGLSLFLIAFLFYLKNRKEYKRTHIKPSGETVLTAIIDQGSSTAFVRLRRRRLISKSLRVAFLAGYGFVLIGGLEQLGLLPSNLLPLPAQLTGVTFTALIVPLLFLVYVGLDGIIFYELMKRIYKFLPGRTGHISSLRRGDGDYKVSVEGIKFNAHSSFELSVGSIVSVKKVIVGRDYKIAMLYVEP